MVDEIVRGNMALVDGSIDFGEIQTTAGQRMLNGKPQTGFSVQRHSQTREGREYVAGYIARRYQENDDKPIIGDDGSVSVVEEETTIEEYSRFAAAEDDILIVDKTWAVPHFVTNTSVFDGEPYAIDLNTWMDEHDVLSSGTVGFQGRLDNADSGTLFGDSVLKDDKLGSEVRNSAMNQVRVEYNRNKGGMTSVYLCASGYVEVYEGVDSIDMFLDFVADEIVPYLVEEQGMRVDRS